MSLAVIGAVLFSAILHAGWNGLLRHSEDRNWTVGWIGVSTCIVCAPFLPMIGFPSRVWPFVLTSAALHVVYLALLAKAYKVNELSFAYPIARGSSPALVALGGLVVAAERPGAIQALGIVAIVLGIVGIGLESKHWDRTGLVIALATGAIIAIYTVVDGMGARRSGLPAQYNLWCFSIYGFAVLILKLSFEGRKAFHGPVKQIAVAFGGGVTSVVAYAIVTWAMVHSPMGVVSALRETSTLFAAGIGLIFLKERFSLQKVAGCIAIVAGAVMIGLG
jgi:drug/metabolite transporter (DMT)-like permease